MESTTAGGTGESSNQSRSGDALERTRSTGDSVGLPMKSSSLKRRWWPYVKWTLFTIVLVFVALRARQVWKDSPHTELRIHAIWLVPSAMMYIVGWIPSIWFWRAMLVQMNQGIGWHAATRAYYVGHVGKYMPGKALVLILRGTMAGEAGANPMLGGVTAAYETLMFMWSGAAMALALAPLTLPEAIWSQLPAIVQSLRHPVWLLPAVALAGTIATTPFSAWLFTLVGRKTLPRDTDAPQAPPLSIRLMMQGAFVTALGWLCHALSLGFALQAVSERHFDLAQFPIWLASTCVSTVGGFVILVAPGGLGIREWLLVEMLKDEIGPAQAVVAAGLLRATWFVSELAAAGLCYVWKPRSNEKS